MQLPGGIWKNGERMRSFAFRELTGEIEMHMSMDCNRVTNQPRRITSILYTALDALGDEKPAWEQIHALCIGDRQYLARNLAAHMGRDDVWLTADCRHCDGKFDMHVKQTAFPIKPAGATYPFVDVKTSRGIKRFRVPNGSDQEYCANIDNENNVLRYLVGRLIVDGSANKLTVNDIKLVENALEEVAPEVGARIQTTCPVCEKDNQIYFDPYAGLKSSYQELLRDIHLIARVYHWSEPEIMALPRKRRKDYIKLIDQSRGVMH